MRSLQRGVLAGVSALALAGCATTGVASAPPPSSAASSTAVPIEPAQPSWAARDAEMDAFLDDLIGRMTL